MRVLPDTPRPRRQAIPRSAAGVGLVELMVVVTIISMLMALAVPSYQRVQKRARAGAIVNDFRVFASVFLAYAHENGAWPAEAPAGVVPTGVTSQDLKLDRWTTPTPIGGHFDWEFMQVHPGGTSPGGTWRAAIAITDTADAPLIIDLDLYQQMDQAIDDGNLSTGSFRLGDGNCPIYILEP
ncbi:MAG TPA: type II secretion system protein [Lacunisphaera sp.]|nr:type II secretion system protein [Lacunisphaera sp.]